MQVMRQLKMTASQKRALVVATVIALIFGAYFLRHYFTLIIFAAILAFLFNPIYQNRLQKGWSSGKAASVTFLLAAFTILIPVTVIVLLTIIQITDLVSSVSNHVNSVDVTNFAQHLMDAINNILAKTPITFRVTAEWLHATFVSVIQDVGTAILNNIKEYASGFFSFFTTAIIFIFVFLSLLKNQDTIQETIRNLNPLGHTVSDLYLKRTSLMTKAMVRGQFIIAVAQGFTDAALIYIAGLHEAFFFLLIVLVALSFIPLGGGILAIPIGIIMILTGNFIGGLIVIAGHLLIVTNIDNVLRPRLVPAEAKLDSALMILSVFSGIALLGFLGIVVGPVIMIIIVTTISVYLEVYRNIGMEKAAVPAQAKSPGFMHRLFGFIK